MSDYRTKPREFALQLYEEYSNGSGELFLEWMNEAFLGKVVENKIDTFNRIWDCLYSNNIKKEHDLCLGDYDYSVWVETPKNEKYDDRKTKILLYKSYCTCSDDNTYIFNMNVPVKKEPEKSVLNDTLYMSIHNEIQRYNYYIEFGVYTAWEKEKKFKFKCDHVEYPSLKTYRKNNWKLCYDDFRDNGFVGKYDSKSGDFKDSFNDVPKALFVLRTLEFIDCALSEEYKDYPEI